MADQFTHDFKYEASGYFIRGEAEFNTDEKASFKINSWSEPLPLTALQDFCDTMERMKAIFVNSGNSLKKIVIKEKEL